MPRHKVVNKSSLPVETMRMRSLYLTDEAMATLNTRAASLYVSTASLLDSLCKTLIQIPDGELLNMLSAEGYLSAKERAYIEKLKASETTSGVKAASSGGTSGSPQALANLKDNDEDEDGVANYGK